jgi:hypothetical protein
MMQSIDLDDYKIMVNHLSELLKKRAAVYPIRDDNYTRLVKAIEEFVDYLVYVVDFKNFQPDPNVIRQTETLVHKPVFICGLEKSGTTLLTQLLDSHPNLLVWPTDGYYFKDIDKWDRNEFLKIARYWTQRLITPTGKPPFWFIGETYKNFEKFLQYLKFFLENSHYDVFVCMLFSIYAVNDGLLKPITYWVEKSTFNSLRAPRILQKYPEAKFIQIIRNPLTNIASYKQYVLQIGKGNFSVNKVVQLMKSLLLAARINQNRLGDSQYHIVKYEDLVAKPKETLLKISAFLNIPFHEVLLVPTENGRPGLSNSMYAEARVHGQILDQSQSRRYQQELTTAELATVTSQLFSVAKDFGYDLEYHPSLQETLLYEIQRFFPKEKIAELWYYDVKPPLKALRSTWRKGER